MIYGLRQRLSLLTYETFAFWIYTLGVAMTAFGPVAHYIGWFLALLSIVYGRIRYNAPLAVKLERDSRQIIYFLFFFLLWSMFAHIPYVDSFYTWGKGASIPLEFLTGLYLAMRLINTSDKRKVFGLAVVAVNLVFCFDVMFRPDFFMLGWNASLDNGNSVASYSLLLMPFFFCYAFWYFEKNIVLKYLLCLTSILLIIFSFSSGGWVTAAVQLAIFGFYASVSKKTNLKSVILFIGASFLLLSVIFSVFGKGPVDSMKRELVQMMSFHDVDVLTTNRKDIWKVSLLMAKVHPVLGSGWTTFGTVFEKKRNNMAEMLSQSLEEHISHPHNMYLSILYSGGFPALFFFMIAYVLSLKKSWSGVRYEVVSNEIPWHLICLISLVSISIYGTNGDVFEGRRDVSVIFWAVWGLLLVIPGRSQSFHISDKRA